MPLEVSNPITGPAPMTDVDRTEQFVRLQTRYQQRVMAFIITLVPHWADAEEILQETNAILWRKFDEYEAGSDFVRWANQVAFFEVQKFRRAKKRESGKLFFSEEFMRGVADDALDATEELQWQRDALAACMDRLSAADRSLIMERYRSSGPIHSLAAAIGRSADSVRKSLQRVRKSLLACVRRKRAAEERVGGS